MKKLTYTLLFSSCTSILVLLIAGCNKEECADCFEEKVSCYVNGEYWEDCCDNCGSVFGGRRHIDCSHRVGSGRMILTAGSSCGSFDISGNLSLVSQELNTTNKLTQNTTRFASSLIGCTLFKIDTMKQNHIHIESIDEENQRIKGTFSFSGEDECGELISVTEGNFHVRFRLP